jgi:hypothetical protein
MSMLALDIALDARDRADLERAIALLERPSFAMRIADLVGQPVNRALKLLPGIASRPLTVVLETALLRCLKTAIDSLDEAPTAPPARWLSTMITGVAGGVGGLFGAAALPIELPLTTILMLRQIAEIARHHGEDLGRLESRLACLEVFALADRRSGKRADLRYYTARSVLTRLTAELAAFAAQRGTVDAASPVVMRLVGEFAGRFGVAVSERAAASALPIVGAVGGAGVNVLFMSHFQQIAEAHFTIRRLERRYGGAPVGSLYRAIASRGAMSAAR